MNFWAHMNLHDANVGGRQNELDGSFKQDH